MNFFSYITAVRQLWPICVDLIRLIEETIPDEGAGSKKLAAFDMMLKAAIDRSEDISDSFEALQPIAHDIVGTVVSLYNAIGQFRTR